MTLAPQETFWAYREAFKDLMSGREGFSAAEPEAEYIAAAGPLPIDEKLIQTIWAQQLLQAEGLRLADGRPVRVLDAGRWNGAAGPDFKGARLMIGADTIGGDVEIHIRASDWLVHGHHRDLDYNGVILHAVLQSDDGRQSDLLHNGKETPRLELEPYIFPDLETLRRSLTADDFEYAQPAGLGRCQRLMTTLDAGTIANFLDRAGDERLVAKMRRLEEQARQTPPEQVFYQSLMMSLGTGPGKTLYYLLAKRTPLAEALDFARELRPEHRNLALEALLLAVAGLLPAEEELKDAPAESRERAERLRGYWRKLEPFWCDRVIPPTRRWFQGIRPVNFPVRRLAGVAILLARAMDKNRMPLAELLSRIRAGAPTLEGAVPMRKKHPLLTELVDWFTVEGRGHFWGTHYSFTARPAERPMTLIGESTAMSLVLNALLPAAYMIGRAENDEKLDAASMKLFSLVPPLQPNHITEFMTRRLFGDDARGGTLINTERRRQGLFQIFHHCCNGEQRHCEACHYLTG